MKTLQELQPLIIEWAKERNILFPENSPKQRLKLIEEAGELASAILKNDIEKQKDAIGDIFVVLVILTKQVNRTIDFENILNNLFKKSKIDDLIIHLVSLNGGTYSIEALVGLSLKLNLDITECANIAWNEIKDRKGNTVNGTFIKES